MFIKNFVLVAIMFLTLNIAIADTLPSVNLIDAKGGSIQSKELLKENTNTLLFFFHVCCHPSIAAIADLNEIPEEDLEEMDVNIILISVDDSRNKNKVIPTLKSRGNKFDFYYDTNSELKRAMGVLDCPHYILYDKKQNKVFERAGYIEDFESILSEKLDAE